MNSPFRVGERETDRKEEGPLPWPSMLFLGFWYCVTLKQT